MENLIKSSQGMCQIASEAGSRMSRRLKLAPLVQVPWSQQWVTFVIMIIVVAIKATIVLHSFVSNGLTSLQNLRQWKLKSKEFIYTGIDLDSFAMMEFSLRDIPNVLESQSQEKIKWNHPNYRNNNMDIAVCNLVTFEFYVCQVWNQNLWSEVGRVNLQTYS